MTDSNDNKAVHEQSLRFIGALTASFSHELNNVVSIVDQNAGLLSDLIAGARNGRPITEERLEKVAAAIQRQTERGLGLIRRINKFAHSTDDPRTRFDLGETLGNLASLCTRLCDMKKVALVRELPQSPVTIDNSPFLIQMLVFRMLTRALARVNAGDNITLELDVTGGGPAILLQATNGFAEPSEEERSIESALAKLLNAQVESDDRSNRILLPALVE